FYQSRREGALPLRRYHRNGEPEDRPRRPVQRDPADAVPAFAAAVRYLRAVARRSRPSAVLLRHPVRGRLARPLDPSPVAVLHESRPRGSDGVHDVQLSVPPTGYLRGRIILQRPVGGRYDSGTPIKAT